MKKMFMFVLMLLIISPVCVKADDHIYSIDVNIYVDENGTAKITEVWDVQADGGTEWCKKLSNLENSDVKGFYVKMDDERLESKEWKQNDSLEENAGHYGIRYISGGLELCFGKKDNERHSFMFGYDLSNYIINTEDSQVLYHVLAPDVTVDSFYADIVAYYTVPNDLETWRFGFQGNSYVDHGRIAYSNYDGISSQYVTALVKFPKDTFKSTKSIKKFETFNDVMEDAENGGYEYKTTKGGWRFIFLDFVFIVLGIIVVILIIEFVYRKVKGKSLLENEKIVKVINPVKEFLKKLFTKVVKLLKKLFVKIKELFKKLVSKVKELIKSLKNKNNNKNHSKDINRFHNDKTYINDNKSNDVDNAYNIDNNNLNDDKNDNQ